MSDFVCKSCGAVVTAENDTEKLFCSHCGNMIFDFKGEHIFYAKPVLVDDTENTSNNIPEPIIPVTEHINYSTKTFEQLEAENAEPKTKSPLVVALVIVAIIAVISAVLVVGLFIVKPSMAYKSACELMSGESYVEAIAAFEALDDYKDSPEKVLECMYSLAEMLYDDGEYEKAIDLCKKLGNYSDSRELADKALLKIQQNALKSSGVGDIVEFGTYEQDNNTENGAEPIEWQVLEVKGNQRMLIAKYGIDCRQYDPRDMHLTWADCELRKWLNGSFMQTAFTPERQSMIMTTSLTNSNNPVYGTWGGTNTNDSIFLLSYYEASVYFPTNAQRQAQPTAYTASKDAEIKQGNCWWWLRTPGVYAVDVCGVHHNGELDPKGCFVYGQRSAVRPVMWVTVE